MTTTQRYLITDMRALHRQSDARTMWLSFADTVLSLTFSDGQGIV